MVYYTILITIVHGLYKPTYNWGAPHCSYDHPLSLSIGNRSVVSLTIPRQRNAAPAQLLLGLSVGVHVSKKHKCKGMYLRFFKYIL